MITIKNYTQSELNFIKTNYNKMTIKELSSHLDKSCNSITYAARKLGLVKQEHTKWTDDDKQYLIDNYIEMTSVAIAKELNKTVVSVNAMRDRLGLVRHNGWSDSETKFLIENFETMSHSDIVSKLGRTKQAITAKCFDLNLYKKERPWEDWETEFVKSNYLEMDKRKIAERLHRTQNAIQLKARRLGLKKYPYTCNYYFFDKIDTEEKAYWLGFLTADGWINKREESNAGVTGIELQYGDVGHLKKFNKSIGGNYKITDRWRKCTISSSDKQNHMCCIRIFSLTMYDSLCKFGFTNNKTFDASIPKLDKCYLRHFMRGYFDGNGCFCFTGKSFHVDFLTASQALYHNLIEFLQSLKITFSETKYVTEYGTQMFRLYINRHSDKLKFLDYIYKNCNVYLDRKYKKYLKVREKYNNHNDRRTD